MIQLVFIIACHKKLRADCDHWSVKENYIEIQGRRKIYLFYFSFEKMVQIMSLAKFRTYKSFVLLTNILSSTHSELKRRFQRSNHTINSPTSKVVDNPNARSFHSSRVEELQRIVMAWIRQTWWSWCQLGSCRQPSSPWCVPEWQNDSWESLLHNSCTMLTKQHGDQVGNIFLCSYCQKIWLSTQTERDVVMKAPISDGMRCNVTFMVGLKSNKWKLRKLVRCNRMTSTVLYLSGNPACTFVIILEKVVGSHPWLLFCSGKGCVPFSVIRI